MVEKELPEWVQQPGADAGEVLKWSYEYVADHLRLYLLYLCPPQVEPEDILSETAVRLAGAVGRLRKDTKLLQYAMRMARNALSTEIRAARKLKAPLRRSDEIIIPFSARLEIVELFNKISRRLTAAQQTLLRLRYVEEKSDEKCATELGVSLKTVQGRKYRLHQAIRREFPDGFE